MPTHLSDLSSYKMPALTVLIAGLLIAPIYYRAGFLMALFSVPLLYALLYLALFDVKTYRLPNIVTYPLIPAGLLLNAYLLGGIPSFYIVGAVAGYAFIWLLRAFYMWRRGIEAIGLGDAKLLAGAGAWLGLFALPQVLLIASFTAILITLFQRLMGAGVDSQTKIPFGPYLCAGFWIVWSLQNTLFANF